MSSPEDKLTLKHIQIEVKDPATGALLQLDAKLEQHLRIVYTKVLSTTYPNTLKEKEAVFYNENSLF